MSEIQKRALLVFAENTARNITRDVQCGVISFSDGVSLLKDELCELCCDPAGYLGVLCA